MAILNAAIEPRAAKRIRLAKRAALVAATGLIVANCALGDKMSARNSNPEIDPKYGVRASPRVAEDGQEIRKGGGVYRVGRPYTVAGRRYVPFEKPPGHAETGLASWYGKDFHGRLTANGEVYNMNSISAAHRTMPMPSYARVTNTRNGHSIIVRVNDRGPFHHSRVIDLSDRTASLLGFKNHGVARVKVEYVGRASLDGSDDRRLEATLRTNGDRAPVPSGSSTMVAATQPAFVPQSVRTPAVVETSQPVPPLAGGMPMPLERPFDLGGNSGAIEPRVFARASTPVVAPALTFAAAPAPALRPTSQTVSAAPAAQQAQVLRPAVGSAMPASALGFQGAGQVGAGTGGLY